MPGPGADGLGRGPGGGVHSGSSGVTLRENTERPKIGGCGSEYAGGSRIREDIERCH